MQQLGGGFGVAVLTTLYLTLGDDGRAAVTAMSTTAVAAAALATAAFLLVFRLPASAEA